MIYLFALIYFVCNAQDEGGVDLIDLGQGWAD